MNSITQDQLVTVKETARALGCSVATIWRRVADGTISKPVKIGGTTRWPASEINELIEKAKSNRDAN